MGNVPRTGRWPMAFNAALQKWLQISNRDPATQQFVVSGPFLATIVPMSGQLQMPSPESGQMVAVDMRARFDASVDVAARAVVTDVSTNDTYTVIYVQDWGEGIEVFLVRRASQ